MNDIVAVFSYLLMTADRLNLFWKWEDNQNFLFQLHILEQLQILSPQSLCNFNTFMLTVLLSHLKAELISVPLRKSEHTNNFIFYNFSPHTSTVKFTAVCSANSLRSKNCHGTELKFEWPFVLPCSSYNSSILWENKTGPDFKDLLIFFSKKECE